MPDATSQLPPEVAARVSKRLSAIGGELFQALDQIREFGHSCILVKMSSPTGEVFQVMLACEELKLALEPQVPQPATQAHAARS